MINSPKGTRRKIDLQSLLLDWPLEPSDKFPSVASVKERERRNSSLFLLDRPSSKRNEMELGSAAWRTTASSSNDRQDRPMDLLVVVDRRKCVVVIVRSRREPLTAEEKNVGRKSIDRSYHRWILRELFTSQRQLSLLFESILHFLLLLS